MADEVKCKGCGSMIWAGAKMTDGYCHDCYARGRHLPPDTEDWPPPPAYPKQTKKKPSFAVKSESEQKERRPSSARKRITWLFIAALIIAGAAWGIYMMSGNRTADHGEPLSAMEALRNEDAAAFANDGESIPDDMLDGKITAIGAFMGSGTDYRMTGLFNYSYPDKTKTVIDLEMFYSGKDDFYKFTLRNTNKTGGFTTIGDVTFYIVTENGKPYVLAEIESGRLVIDPDGEDNTFGEGLGAYEFLMGFVMEDIIETDFILDSETTSRSLNGGDYFARDYTYEGTASSVFGGYRRELRAHEDQPVYYYYCDLSVEESTYGTEFEAIINYYYDEIPQDAPSVADYQ